MNGARFSASTWIASLGVGFLPGAPGTYASAAAAGAWYFLPHLSLIPWLVVLGTLLLVGAVVSGRAAALAEERDPSSVVIDEWLGMWVALSATPRDWRWGAAAFLLFRILDVAKPGPIRRMERFRAGWGIMLDDALAGAGVFLLTLLALQLR